MGSHLRKNGCPKIAIAPMRSVPSLEVHLTFWSAPKAEKVGTQRTPSLYTLKMNGPSLAYAGTSTSIDAM